MATGQPGPQGIQSGTREKMTLVGSFVGSASYLLVLGLIAIHDECRRIPAILCSIAFCSIGAFVGFLFGVPKVEQSNEEPQEAGQGDSHYRMKVNTNLEQISDWLTKILVGIGLVQLRELPELLTRLSKFVSPGIGKHPGPQAEVLAMAIIVLSLLLGFSFGYMVTRLFLAQAFKRADEALQRSVIVADEELSLQEAEDRKMEILSDLQQQVLELRGKLSQAGEDEVVMEGEPAGQEEIEQWYRDLQAPRSPAIGAPSSATLQPGSVAGAPRGDSPAPGSAGSSPLRVLWVDDNPKNNAYEARFLRDRGVSVELATSTQDALARFRKGSFNRVITDLGRIEEGSNKPLAGLELVQELKKLQPTLRIVVHTTSSAARKHGEALRAAGASAITSSRTVLFEALGLR